ncbi:MAG: hypothetical protein WC878_05050 [Candidatus Paceibacterota bacterium]|jgi:hypothetical protein
MKKEIKKSTKTKVKKETDIEMLARIVLNGFDEIKQTISTLATKEELNGRCDRIEFLLLRAQDNRLDRLEDKMRKVETALEIA